MVLMVERKYLQQTDHYHTGLTNGFTTENIILYDYRINLCIRNLFFVLMLHESTAFQICIGYKY